MNRSLKYEFLAVGVVLSLVLVSCRTYTEDQVEMAGLEMLPAGYTVYSAVAENSDNWWWTSFGDQQMVDIIRAVLENNLTLVQAEARLRQSAAIAAQRGADFFPKATIEGQALQTRSKETNADGVAETSSREEYSLTAACSYEVDLWGRVRAGRKSAGMEMEATRADYETAAMTIAAETALKYLELLAVRERHDLLSEQYATALQILELVELRYRKSMASALDVFQQRESVARIKTFFPAVKTGEETVMNELAVLLGVPLDKAPVVSSRTLPEKPVLPPTGLPADILVRRPDIRAAALRLRGSGWQVSAARADLMPALRLTGGAGFKSDELSVLFDDMISSLAASLIGPVFEGGRRRAEVVRTKAVVEERLAAYKLATLRAVSEVQEAIIRETRQTEYVAALKEQLDAASDTVSEARNRYSKGAESYLPVLTASISQQNIQLSLVEARYEDLAWRIKLYRSLGGDWAGILKGNIK